jgi:Lon protease-like protein
LFQLPLFPLNTVLFPNTPLPLHIFEERYKVMIEECMAGRRTFGVVLIKQGTPELGPLAEPHRVGCSAQITHLEPLQDGRMNIVVVGQERFRIRTLDSSRPYLVGSVESFPWTDTDSVLMALRTRPLIRLYERYLRTLAKADLVDIAALQTPAEPIDLAHAAAHVLQVPQDAKQELLETESASDLLGALINHYRLEAPLLEAILSQEPSEEEPASFSRN